MNWGQLCNIIILESLNFRNDLLSTLVSRILEHLQRFARLFLYRQSVGIVALFDRIN